MKGGGTYRQLLQGWPLFRPLACVSFCIARENRPVIASLVERRAWGFRSRIEGSGAFWVPEGEALRPGDRPDMWLCKHPTLPKE